MAVSLPRFPLPVPLPRHLLRPVRLVPQPLLESVIARLAQQVLADPVRDGSLESLQGRILAVVVSEPVLRLRFTLREGQLRSAGAGPADVTISASADDLVMLAARRTDPDTLFFQRRLRLSGDTELGLAVKNVLDAVAPDALPPALDAVLQRMANLVDTEHEHTPLDT
jgi:O2-independent ubiquinone biosynthesis accessory factor UbiT